MSRTMDDILSRITAGMQHAPVTVRQCTDLANGERLAERYGDSLRYTLHGGWHYFDGARWQRDEMREAGRLAKDTALAIFDESAQVQQEVQRVQKELASATAAGDAAAMEKAQQELGKTTKQYRGLIAWALNSQNRARQEAMLAMAQSEPAITAHQNDFDRYPMLLNIQNGTLNLRTGTLKPHEPGDLLTKIAGTHYDESAACPTWLTFLDRIFDGDGDMVGFVQRAIGYSLTGETGEQCLFFCYGSGANGKSTLLNIITELLGDYAAKTPSETLIVKKFGGGIPNDIARLAGARFVCASELTDRRLNEGLVKDMTGQDTLVGRFLNHEYFEYRPQFKLWMSGNHKPVISGTDDGVWRRVKLIPFAVTIPESERDPRLPDKLRAELPGILAWAMQGCLDWQASGLRTPDAVRAATAAYRSEMDTIGGWLAECCITDDSKATATAGALLDSWKAWSGESNTTARWLARQLRERGFEPGKLPDGTRAWGGVGLIA